MSCAALWNDGKASTMIAVYRKLGISPFSHELEERKKKDNRSAEQRAKNRTLVGKIPREKSKRTHSART